MALNTAQGFHVGSAQPIDDKFKLTKAEMLTIDENIMPEQYFCVCVDDGNMYTFDKNREANAETGKFRIVSGNGVDLKQNYPLKIPVYSRRDSDNDGYYVLIATIDLTNLEAITCPLNFKGIIGHKNNPNSLLLVDLSLEVRNSIGSNVLSGSIHGNLNTFTNFDIVIRRSSDEKTMYMYAYGVSVMGEFTIANETVAYTIPTTFTWVSEPMGSNNVVRASGGSYISNTYPTSSIDESSRYRYSEVASTGGVYDVFLLLQEQIDSLRNELGMYLTSLTNTTQEVEE